MNTQVVFGNEIAAWQFQDGGYQCMLKNDYVRAIDYFHEALKYAPNDARTHWNLGFSLLAIGNYVQGFEHIEWRWQVYDWCWGYLDKDIYRIKSVPTWRSERLTGKHLLLYHEQGYGDAIMMARFIPVLKSMAGKVTLMSVAPLARLMANQFDLDVVVNLPEDLSGFDYRCAIFDPMRWLNQTVLTLPRAPYIKCDLDPISDTMGIVWSGKSQTKYTVETFLQNLGGGGRRLYALQHGSVPPHVEPLAAKDFADTLDVLRRMETIVSADTALVHLAAAAGHPSVHLILPNFGEWRWHHAYAWYPRLRLHPNWESLNMALQA